MTGVTKRGGMVLGRGLDALAAQCRSSGDYRGAKDIKLVLVGSLWRGALFLFLNPEVGSDKRSCSRYVMRDNTRDSSRVIQSHRWWSNWALCSTFIRIMSPLPRMTGKEHKAVTASCVQHGASVQL